MDASPDVLLFVEDPGAANFIAPLPAALSTGGSTSKIIAVGTAASLLKQRGIDFEMPDATETDEGILTRIKPRVLVVGTASSPDTCALGLIKAAQRAGIPSVGVVDAAMNSSLRFRGRGDNPLGYAPDLILVPDDWVRASFLTLGIPSERVLAVGNPHYDFIAERFNQWRSTPHAAWRKRLFPAAASDQKIVVFASEGSQRLGSPSTEELAHYTLRGRGAAGRSEIVLEEVLDALATVTPRPYFVLRIHPRDEPNDYAAYRNEIDQLSSGEPALEVVQAADLLIGMTSQLLTEAALLGRPALAVIPVAGEKEWLPGLRLGITPCVTTRDELRATLPVLLANGLRAPHAATGQMMLSGARDRIRDLLVSLLKRPHS